jgi:hypothetical protein
LWIWADLSVSVPVLSAASFFEGSFDAADYAGVAETIVKRSGALSHVVPQSLARECHVLPLAQSDHGFLLASSVAVRQAGFDKLRFILNCDLFILPADEDWLDAQIDALFAEPPQA